MYSQKKGTKTVTGQKVHFCNLFTPKGCIFKGTISAESVNICSFWKGVPLLYHFFCLFF